jgi:hypothetical protein
MSLPNVIDSGKPLSIVVLSGILLPLVIACGITADSPASHHGDATPRYIVYYNSNSTPLLEVARADYSHVILSFIQVLVEENGSLRIVPPPHMNGNENCKPKADELFP